MSYCVVADVEALAQPGGTSGILFSSSTRPNLTQVSGFIEKITDHMNGRLTGMGFVLPITLPTALGHLALINSWGAAALVEYARGGREGEKAPPIADNWWSKYMGALDELEEKPGILGGVSRTSGSPRSLQTSRTVDGSDENYSDMNPWFRRDTQF